MALPVIYLRREPTTDATTLRYAPEAAKTALDVQSYRDPEASAPGMARWPWRYTQSKPTRRNRYVVLACMRYRIVWLPDLKREG